MALRWMGWDSTSYRGKRARRTKKRVKRREKKRSNMRVGMKEQRVRKIYAKLVQRNEGIKEAVGNIEWEDLGGSCLEHLVRS